MNLYNISLPPLETLFTYRLESAALPVNPIGFRVLVPLGKRSVYGLIIEECVLQNPGLKEIKSIIELMGDAPVASPELISFCRWISKYYSEPLSQVLDCAIPAIVLRKSDLWIKLISDQEPPAEPNLRFRLLTICALIIMKPH